MTPGAKHVSAHVGRRKIRFLDANVGPSGVMRRELLTLLNANSASASALVVRDDGAETHGRQSK
jgi:hypothetical protein